MSLSPPANLFLAHRLSIEEFERDVVSARNADHAKSSPSHRNAIGLVDASKEQVVEVRGFGADAIEAIKVATNGEQEILTTLLSGLWYDMKSYASGRLKLSSNACLYA